MKLQEKVMAQIEKEGKGAAKPKAEKKPAAKTATAAPTAGKAAEIEKVEAEDPVTTALNKYGIVTENPYKKGDMYALTLSCMCIVMYSL